MVWPGHSQAGIGRIEANLKGLVRKKKLTEDSAAAARKLLSGTLSYDNFQKVDMVVEAAIEVQLRIILNSRT